MQLNTDFSQRVVVDSASLPWVASPSPGVWRKMLERDGDEVARVTSIVRYDAGSQFPSHLHGGGEEIFVLEGVFEDEHGTYPAGTYLKNPVGSSHSPGSKTGCVLLVKLRHLSAEDTHQVVIDTNQAQWAPSVKPCLHTIKLDRFKNIETQLVRWDAGCEFPYQRHMGGKEIFILQGDIEDEYGSYTKGTWVRMPHDSAHSLRSVNGCIMWCKCGHLGLIPQF